MHPRIRHNDTNAAASLAKLMMPYLKRFSRRFHPGSFIYKENETAHYVFFVINGLVKLTKQCLSNENKQVMTVHSRKFMGMEAIFPYGYYYCSAIAVTECVICMVPKEIFVEEFYQYNAATALMIDQLYHHIKITEEKIRKAEDKTQHNTASRSFEPFNRIYRNIL
jgi:CRP-like cAMP-binding protein